MLLVVGLGNPGSKYEGNRHNVGFMVAEEVARRWRLSFGSEKWKARIARGSIAGRDTLLVLPQNYMNLSGESAGAAARFYKIDNADILVVHDELDLEFGRVAVKKGGGTAGHNGLRSLAQHLGGGDFDRVRFGIGRPVGQKSVTAHVLGDFSPDERKELDALVDKAADAVELWAREGIRTAMNRINVRPPKPRKPRPEAGEAGPGKEPENVQAKKPASGPGKEPASGPGGSDRPAGGATGAGERDRGDGPDGPGGG